MQPHEWAKRWKVSLLEEIPIQGPATAKDWKGCAPGTTRYPGRNHPRVGAWLANRYRLLCCLQADPMIGAGGLWLRTYSLPPLGCDASTQAVELAHQNLNFKVLPDKWVTVARAETWTPDSRRVGLVMLSPPFAQNHSSEATAHQKEIRERKNLHAVQEFSSEMPDMIRGYTQFRSYCKGKMVVILRNRISKVQEVDEIGPQIDLMRMARWNVLGVHPRDLLRPTGYQQWKVAKDSSTPWIRWEWAVVAE